ncbi:PspA/IM30 family protein, partial [Ruminococcus sp.]
NYKEMFESISAQTEAIGDQVEVLKSKLEEAKSLQAMLIARSQMADTQKSLAKAAGSFDPNSSFDKFQRMEEKVVRKEAEAAAFTEIAGDALTGGTGDELKNTISDLESEAKVAAELQRLLAEMNGGSSNSTN